MRIPAVGETFGPYLVQRELGRGAMGSVFVATQVALNRPVALKVLLPQFADSEDYRRRFQREASALASAQSPHIVAIYDHGEIDGALYIATQLVPGGDVGNRLATGPMSTADALRVMRQVATALADAHGVGVLHRDVKPSNVLIWDRSDGIHAYLCDFGIAKVEGSGQHTSTEGIIGTWAYLSPERCSGAPASEASDIYAAGGLLWSLLTGTAPYDGTAVELAMAHVTRPVPQLPVATAEDESTSALNQILRRSMAKDPTHRYATAAQLAQAISEAIAGVERESVAAPADATVIAAEPFVPPAGPPAEPRRRFGMAAGLAAVALVVATLAGVAWAQGWRPAFRESGEPTGGPPTTNPRAECWDGATADQLSECTTPRGLAGLAWVFPSLRPDQPECSTRQAEVDGKLDVVICTFEFRGTPGLVRYTSWANLDRSHRYYNGQYPAAPRLANGPESAARWVWRLSARTERGRIRMSTAYVDWPFSVSVEAGTLAAREWAYRQLAFRPDSQMTGIEQGDGR